MSEKRNVEEESSTVAPSAKRTKTGDGARRVARKKKGVRKATSANPPLPTWTYSPGDLIPDLSKNIGDILSVVVPRRFFDPEYDRANFERQLWGSQVYTDDSDILSLLLHADKFELPSTEPDYDLLAKFKICPREEKYVVSTNKKTMLKSRPWSGLHDGTSLRVEKVIKVTSPKKGEEKIPEKEHVASTKDRSARYKAKMEKEDRRVLSDAWNHLSDCSIVFNLSNDPVLKYSTTLVEDRGVSHQSFTSARFLKESLYVETLTRRFQISASRKANSGSNKCLFMFAEVKKPFAVTNSNAERVVPLPAHLVNVLQDVLTWNDFVWTTEGVTVQGNRYKLQSGVWRHNTVV
eukprot:CFRG5665T1